MPYLIRYSFSQQFAVSARAAFDWCTDYRTDDHELTGNANVKHTISKITDSTILLKDTFQTGGSTVEKEKLVQLYPDRLMWISTHLSGPTKYSQFIYQIIPQGKCTSRLDFSALHVEHKEGLSKKDLEQLTGELCSGDSAMWRLFAAAMEKEFG
ncbi:MAG TPA: hypothetical protein VLH35_00385 [Candidatus Acidoferrales bacterium]|nr:hypothetical protein [Candidatus Acidoferrales bacterium]